MGVTLKSRELVILCYAVPSVFLILEYFLVSPDSVFRTAGNELLSWAVLLWTFSYLLGGFALFRYHLTIIRNQREGFQYSIIILGSFIFFMLLGAIRSAGNPVPYDWFWTNLLLPVTIGMFSFAGLYIFIIFFRGARTRSWEAGLLLVVAILLMLYQAPAGPAFWSGFETIGSWINRVPNTAGFRGITIGVAMGMLALFVRTILGLERAQLGETGGD